MTNKLTNESIDKQTTQISNENNFEKRLRALNMVSYLKGQVKRIHFSPKDFILNSSSIYTNLKAYTLESLKQICWLDDLLFQLRVWLTETWPSEFKYDKKWNDKNRLQIEINQINDKIRKERLNDEDLDIIHEFSLDVDSNTKKNLKKEKHSKSYDIRDEENKIFNGEVNPYFIEVILYIILIESNEDFIQWISTYIAKELKPTQKNNQPLKSENNDKQQLDDLSQSRKAKNRNIIETHLKWLSHIMDHRKDCQLRLEYHLKKENKSNVNEFIPQSLLLNTITLPKYVRPNRHRKMTSEQVESILQKHGLNKGPSLQETKKLCTIGFRDQPFYYPDDLIPGLFLIPHDFPTHQIAEIHSGKIIIQDKSSCLPPYALFDTLKKLKYLNKKDKKITVIDACAAPGNKTSLLGELLLDYPNAQVYATEIDKRRYVMLQQRMKQFGAKNVKVFHSDFFKFDFKNNKTIKAIMLDPSCSGSGMTSRDSYFADDTEDRVEKLASFQEKILRHSLRQPNVEVIVYSTCSIHDRENEIVMHNAQSLSNNEGKKYSFYPVFNQLNHNRGKVLGEAYKDCDKCVRFEATKDYCGGFFVGCFVRESSLHQKISGIKRKKELSATQLARKKRRLELQKELYGK